MVEKDPLLTVFFYGTLKRGHANHDRFRRGYLTVEEAWTRGRLYSLPFGYPALVIDEEDVPAAGTTDPTSDASEQRSFGLTGGRLLDGPRVSGELFAFGDPEERLPVLDHLEGFDPAWRSSLYRRVLIPVETSGGVGLLAWAYVVQRASGVYLPGGRWPP
jgi:gamma-glutamylcyclotransferase (GGCT)/AIG2-like uncharacterized protein YtfP